MARTVQTARRSTGGKAPKKMLASKGARMADSGDSNGDTPKKRGDLTDVEVLWHF